MINHYFADVNSIRMHYATKGTGKLLLMLHGFPEYWGVWKRLIDSFSKKFHVVAPDLRGYNLTDKPQDTSMYHISHLVEDIRALTEHLGHDTFYLAAQDWGAQVAWSFIFRYPERVEKLISLNATHPALFNRELQTNPEQQKASQYMLMFRSPQAEDIISDKDYGWFREIIFSPLLQKSVISEEEIDEWVDAWNQPGAITGGLNYYRASVIGPPDGTGSKGGSNILEDLSPESLKVTVPTLLLYGENDPYRLPGSLIGLEEYVENLTIKRIPNAGHWICIEKTEVVETMIRKFLC